MMLWDGSGFSVLSKELEKVVLTPHKPLSHVPKFAHAEGCALVWVDCVSHTRRNWCSDLVFMRCSIIESWCCLAPCGDRCEMRDRRF